MRFLRTASTGRLLAAIFGVAAVAAAAAAIAVAATGSGPVPRREPLASSVHSALTAPPVSGFSADINFTNNLISSTDFTGDSRDPILQGASGRIWISNDGALRLELQGDNGDSQVVLNKGSFWVSDPTSQTVYEGTLPAGSSSKPSSAGQGVATVAEIQSDITRLMGHLDLAGATTSDPTDVGGRPAYSVSISPKHDGGLLGSAQVAWDAITGVPLKIAVYARGNSTPVLALSATNISYGRISSGAFAVSPPSNYKVVKIATPSGTAGASAHGARRAHHAAVTGVGAVAGQVPFTLAAPASLVGLPRREVKLLSWGGSPAALVTYGQNLGGIAVVEQEASAGGAGGDSRSSTGDANLSLPTVSINGATGTELATALGTVLTYTSNGVAYTVLGSVPPAAAEQAARALAP